MLNVFKKPQQNDMQAFNVFIGDSVVDTVYHAPMYSTEHMRDDLIQEGYPAEIMVQIKH